MSEQGTGGQAPQGRPGRYQRSFVGLIGAMVITLVAIGGFVLFRAVTRDTPEVDLKPVDYRGLVAEQQSVGRTPIYPRSLPEGWRATSVSYDAGERPGWSIGIHTEDGTYAGLRQQEADELAMLQTYVDEEPAREGTETIDSEVAQEWQVWSDEGGDHAFVAESGGETVMVYGSASVSDLRTLVGLLTDAPVR